MKKLRLITAAILIISLCASLASCLYAGAETGCRICFTESIGLTDDFISQLKLLSSELGSATGENKSATLYCGGNTRAGDISLIADNTLTGENYTVTNSDAGILELRAATHDGFFRALRYVIKYYCVYGADADVADTSVDFATGERALFLDIGRKYYTPQFLTKLIKELSFLDMNTLVLHFSEEMGLGLESKLYPWLNGRDGTLCVPTEIETDNRFITQDELKDIMATASLYNVSVVPSFDSPGHMNYIVKKFNEKAAEGSFTFTFNGTAYTVPEGYDIGNYYHWNGQTAIVQGSRNTAYSRGIDISDEIAAAFTKSLLGEYADLFASLGSTAIDIGGDELLGWGSSLTKSVSKWKQLDNWKTLAQKKTGNKNAVAYDLFLLYMNDLYDFVTDKGYTSVRMWNDDALRSADTGWTGVVQLNKNIEIEYWTPTANSSRNTVTTYTGAGYKVYNYINYYNYYVLGKGGYDGANADSIWSSWTPSVFSSDGTQTATAQGCAFCVWADNPSAESEDSVFNNVIPMLKAVSAKSINPDINKKYTTYFKYARTLPGLYSTVFATLPAQTEITYPSAETTTEETTTEETTTAPEETATETSPLPETTTAEATTSPEETTAEVTTTPEKTTAEVTTTPEKTTAEVTTAPEITTAEVTTAPEKTTAEATTSPEETAGGGTTLPAESTTTGDDLKWTRGDVDGDGSISVSDARLTLRAAVHLDSYAPSSRRFFACDYSADGTVTVSDARTILRIAVGLE